MKHLCGGEVVLQ